MTATDNQQVTTGRWAATAVVNDNIANVLDATSGVRRRITDHSMYPRLDTIDAARVFMESHVYAVLDFMWLLKSLQRDTTCVDVPWLPAPDKEACRFVNELVLGEESDEWEGGWSSHFEIYLEAMDQAGADRADIDRYIEVLRNGADPIQSLDELNCAEGPKQFVRTSARLALEGEPHERAAAFAFGREELIPSMFTALLETVQRRPADLSILGEYLSRHIELDGDIHTPLAFGLVASLCGDDERRWTEATDAAIFSLEARVALWDDIALRL